MNKGFYSIMRVTDDGPYVTKFILPVPEVIKKGEVDKDTFSVYAERYDDHGDVLLRPATDEFLKREGKMIPSKGYITVKNAYPSTLCGEEVEEGSYVALDLKFGPTEPLTSKMTWTDHNIMIQAAYEITQVKDIENHLLNGLKYDQLLEERQPDLENWQYRYTDGKEICQYAYFVPQTTQKKIPLVIWLHGGGEGGSDIRIPFCANKVVSLASEKVQSYFKGAYVMVPQCPTFWMDNGSGEVTDDFPTIYIDSLKAAIDEFIANNPAIDTRRIYLGGDSNGGYMTVRMIIEYPDFFAAAFPTCEALLDTEISDEMIESIKDMPVWFTAAKNDTVVPVYDYAVPTYQRLIAAGAKNAHLSLWDDVTDVYGAYDLEDGKPHEYMGHFSWVHVLNDACRLDFDKKPVKCGGRNVTLLQWVSKQKKK